MQFQQRFYEVLMPLTLIFNRQTKGKTRVFLNMFSHIFKDLNAFISMFQRIYTPYENSFKKIVRHMRQWHCSGLAAHGTGRRGYF